MGRGQASEIHTELDTPGLLQLTWLVGQEPAIAERIVETDEPTQDNLRRAGLFEVNLGEEVPKDLTRRNIAPKLREFAREDES